MHTTQSRKHRGVVSALAIVLALGLWGLAPEARAEHPKTSGVTFDGRGVHFWFQNAHHYYANDRYPRAQSFFRANKHFRKAQKYERRREQWVQRAFRNLSYGNYDRARRAFETAVQFETRRQRQLAKLDHDRARFERRWKPRHHDHHDWRHHSRRR